MSGKVKIRRAELAAFAAHRLKLILAEDAAFPDIGVETWRLCRETSGDFSLSRDPAEDREDFTDLPGAPPGLIAIVSDQPEIPPVLRAAQTPILPADPALALPAILENLAAENARLQSACGDLQLSLARLREEQDQIAKSSLRLAEALAHKAEGPLTLLAAGEPAKISIRLDKSYPLLVQPLGLRADRCTAFAFVILRGQAEAGDVLRVRLSGQESGRILGSWLIPPEALTPGWRTLEFPSPPLWVPETAQLEFHFTCNAGYLELAKDRVAGFAENLPTRPGAANPTRPLALRVWSAEPGTRYLRPDHWDWAEPGAAVLPDNIPLALPQSAFARLRVMSGGTVRDFDPADSPLVIGAEGGRQTLVIFPLVCVTGQDIAAAEVSLRGGDERALAVALWLQPLGHAIAGETDLLVEGPDVAWSGWRVFGGKGEARAAVEIPATAAANLQLVIVLDATLRPASGRSFVELRKILFHAANPGTAIRRRAFVAGGGLVARALEPAIATAPVASMGQVILDEHFDNRTSYRHLDMRIGDFTMGDYSWPFLKFRFVVDRGNPCLEFRDIPSWPKSVTGWPGATKDEHGRLIRLFGTPEELEAWRAQATPQDMALIAGLIPCFAGVVARAARLAQLPASECAEWGDLAEKLCERLESFRSFPGQAIDG